MCARTVPIRRLRTQIGTRPRTLSRTRSIWLQQYGFPLDGSADYADADGDGMNNWQEWRAGTVPTDPRSLLVISNLTLNISGATLTWQSQTNVPYYIQRATDPGAAFSTIQSNITGWAGSTSYTDTNATGAFFYRVGVQ